jgi:hypothetical protein
MSGYRYKDRGDEVFDYLYEGDAGSPSSAAVGISREGSLVEALVRAAEHARDRSDGQNVPVGTTMRVKYIEVEIGPNPPISQYKVVLEIS